MLASDSHGGCEPIFTTTARTLIHTIMAITNKEIIQNQLNRINRKLGTDLSLTTENDETCYLQSNRQVLFENMECYRSEEQMIEYLSILEDVIDFFMKKKE